MKTSNKLWFMSVNRVSDRDFVRYGLQELALKGVNIEVVDVSNLMWGTKDEMLINNIAFNLNYCSKLNEFKSIINRISSDDTVLCGGVLSPLLHQLISIKCRYIGLQVLGAIPEINAPRNKLITTISAAFKHKSIIKKILRKIYNNFVFKKYPFYFVQRGGCASSTLYPGVNSRTRILECQCYDIYEFLYETQSRTVEKIIPNGEYLLWIDQAIPLHTDTLKINGDISSYSESYFSRIQSLLKRYEESTGIKIVVSLHPRMVRDPRYIAFWKDWNVIKKDTIEYIKNAKICLTHNSTAIHAVVFFRKPLVIIKDRLLSEHGYDSGITDSFFYELDCNLIESDCSDFSNFSFDINEEKYTNYIQKYVSKEMLVNPINAEKLFDFMSDIKNSKVHK